MTKPVEQWPASVRFALCQLVPAQLEPTWLVPSRLTLAQLEPFWLDPVRPGLIRHVPSQPVPV